MNVSCRDLGLMEYKTCWDLQQSIFDGIIAHKTALAATAEPATTGNLSEAAQNPKVENHAGTILLVEHPPVYTLGKSGHAENLLIDRQGLERLGAQFFHIDRGGDITFHGPGQLVCYPILDLEALGLGLREYIDALEEAVIRTVGTYGITAGRIAGASGVWVGATEEAEAKAIAVEVAEAAEATVEAAAVKQQLASATRRTPRKICAIGVRSSRFVTMHGFALNVSTDIKWFSRINPCGFTDKGVTSMELEVARPIQMDEVKALVIKFLSEILNVKIYNN